MVTSNQDWSGLVDRINSIKARIARLELKAGIVGVGGIMDRLVFLETIADFYGLCDFTDGAS
jgi:hypothetical protein